MARTAKEIAEMIDRLQQYYAAISTTLLMLNNDDLLRSLHATGHEKGSTIRLGRKDNSHYENINMWDSIQAVKGNSAFNLDFLRSQLMIIMSWVGHELSSNKYICKTPELEFFRHLRNGISHGNTFKLLNGEPHQPATFKAFEVTSALNGKQVLFEFMSPGDLFDLFDHVKGHLRTLS